MNLTIEIETEIERLLQVLDLECNQLEEVMDFMAQLGRGVLKRDDASLSALLEQVRSQGQMHVSTQQQREQIRARLAGLLSCSSDALRLSALEKLSDGNLAAAVRKRRLRLTALVEKLGNQHRCTAGIVSEMARINRSLLSAVTGGGNTTYNGAGRSTWAATGSLLSMRY